MKHTDVSSGNAPKTPLGAWIAAKTTDCYVCDHFHQIYGRYLDTFFDLYKKNEEFAHFLKKQGILPAALRGPDRGSRGQADR